VDYYCWLVWCERKILFWLEIYDRLRPSEQALKLGWICIMRWKKKAIRIIYRCCCGYDDYSLAGQANSSSWKNQLYLFRTQKMYSYMRREKKSK